MTAHDELRERLALVESRLAALEASPAKTEQRAAPPQVFDSDVFFALNGLKARTPASGGVVFAGFLGSEEGNLDWQYGATYDALVERDWSEQATRLEALASPVRLTILQSVHAGIDTVIRLATVPSLGSSGQIYHHINLLVAARWLVQAGRGRYAIPPERVVPLLVILTASERL